MKVVAVILACFALASAKDDYLWTEIDGEYEGLVEVGAYTLNGCLVQCVYLEHCCLASFDETSKKCRIQMEKEVKLVPRTSNCTLKTFKFPRDKFFNGDICWKKFTGKRIKGLTNISFDPRNNCMTYCIGCRICISVTYDTSTTPNCWIQLATDALHVNYNSLQPSNTSISYVLDKVCLFQKQYLKK